MKFDTKKACFADIKQTKQALVHHYLVFVYKVQLLRCCSKSKSSNTLVFCGLYFSHALNLNFLFQTREKRLVYRQAQFNAHP
jgi:hypothetical protein